MKNNAYWAALMPSRPLKKGKWSISVRFHAAGVKCKAGRNNRIISIQSVCLADIYFLTLEWKGNLLVRAFKYRTPSGKSLLLKSSKCLREILCFTGAYVAG